LLNKVDGAKRRGYAMNKHNQESIALQLRNTTGASARPFHFFQHAERCLSYLFARWQIEKLPIGQCPAKPFANVPQEVSFLSYHTRKFLGKWSDYSRYSQSRKRFTMKKRQENGWTEMPPPR
jgi:hypothetical protein